MDSVSSTAVELTLCGRHEGRTAGLGTLFGDRAARVTAMLLCICVLSVYDLLHTLAYVQTMGMIELNPLARLMVEMGGLQQLVLFKLLTISLSCGILYFVRRMKPAEVASIIGLIVMVLLTIYWFVYNEQIVQLSSVIDFSRLDDDPRWVQSR